MFDWGAVGQAVTGLATAGINAWSQGIANKDNRHFAQGVMDQQRQWALDDWNRQNEYNSPKQQMQRFKEAGLNPNLIYGQTNTAPPVRSTDSARAQAIAPHIQLPDVQGIIGRSQEIKQTAVQTDNLKAQNALIQAQVIKVLTDIDQKSLSNDMTRQLWNNNLEMAQEKLRKLQYDSDLSNARTTFTMEENERKNKQQPLILDRLGALIAWNKSQTAMQPFNRQKIEATTDEIRSRIQLQDLEKMNKRNQLSIWDDIHQGILKKNLLIEDQRNNLKAQKELMDIKARWRDMGLSETAISDLLNVLKGIALPKYMR